MNDFSPSNLRSLSSDVVINNDAKRRDAAHSEEEGKEQRAITKGMLPIQVSILLQALENLGGPAFVPDLFVFRPKNVQTRSLQLEKQLSDSKQALELANRSLLKRKGRQRSQTSASRYF